MITVRKAIDGLVGEHNAARDERAGGDCER